MRKNRGRAGGVAAALVGLVCTSCLARFDVEGDGTLTERSAYGRDTVATSLYGLAWSSEQVQKCEDQLGLYRVRYTTNALLLFASVASLGAYVPQTVEWWCQASPEEDDGELLQLGDELESEGARP